MKAANQTPAPWLLADQPDDQGRRLIICGNPNDPAGGQPIAALSNPADAHLICAAPELMELARRFYRETLAERDCFYDGCANADTGEVDLEEDQMQLDYYDKLLFKIAGVINQAGGTIHV